MKPYVIQCTRQNRLVDRLSDANTELGFDLMCCFLPFYRAVSFLTYLWMVLFILSNDASSEFGYSFSILVTVAPKDEVFSDRLSNLFNMINEIATKQC